jgi:hypothetical protein
MRFSPELPRCCSPRAANADSISLLRFSNSWSACARSASRLNVWVSSALLSIFFEAGGSTPYSFSIRYRADGARNNPPKLASVNYGIAYFSNSIPGDYRYADYKTQVTAALKKSFGNSASTGTKAIKIAADGGRRGADPVLAAQFHYYYSSSCGVKYRFEEGSSSFLSFTKFQTNIYPGCRRTMRTEHGRSFGNSFSNTSQYH